MCSPPMLEMSKPSIRTGSVSRLEPVLKRGERVDSLGAAALLAQPVLSQREGCVALGELAQPALRTALGDAHLDRATAPRRERIGDHAGALAHRGADDDQARDRRRRRVVLGEELLGDLGLGGLGLVGEVEAVALGESAIAHLEDLGIRLGALDGDRDQVGRLERLAGDRAPLHQ